MNEKVAWLVSVSLTILIGALLVSIIMVESARGDDRVYVPDYVGRSLDKVIITRPDGTQNTIQMPPGSGTSYLFLPKPDDNERSHEPTDEESESTDEGELGW